MYICKYCNKQCKAGCGLEMHERSCEKNPNRIPGTFSGKKHNNITKKSIGSKNREGLKTPQNIFDVSTRTKNKIVRRMNLGCSLCGWDKGSCDIHHIIPKSQGGDNNHDNLTHICPNCHRLAHEGKIDKFISLNEQVGNSWIDHYYAYKE